MNASDTVKSTRAVVAFDSEPNIHQARLAYSWNHLTTLHLSGLPNTHLQHLGHMLTSEKKEGAQQSCANVYTIGKATRIPGDRRADSSGGNAEVDEREDLIQGERVQTLQHTLCLTGSKGVMWQWECMTLLGDPAIYKILMVEYWVWEQRTSHHDNLRGKIKELKKNKRSKPAQLKWKATALPLQFHGTVLWSPVRVRVPWRAGNRPILATR